MIAKLPVLGFALVTAVSGQALADEGCAPRAAAPTSYGGHAGNYTPVDYGRAQPTYAGPAYPAYGDGSSDRGGYTQELRRSDLNRDGWVSMGEALDYGRVDFQRTDRDRNRVLTRHEYGRRSELASEDLNRDGRVTFREHQQGVRVQFARMDANRDGFLASYELDGRARPVPAPRVGPRSAGWRR